MPTTTLVNPAAGFKAWALQARTDTAGAAVDDIDGEDSRLVLEVIDPGVVAPTNGYQVLENSPQGMSVLVGSGTAESDVAVIAGTAAGQGKYLARNQDAATVVTLAAADASNPRIDEIYVIVQDNQYDSSARVLPRIGYREGDPSVSPSAPGPDGAWTAYLLLATIQVGAAVSLIENADITDNRTIVQYMSKALFEAKGSLVAATGSGTPATVAVGANNTVLTADSAESTGVKWAQVDHGATAGLGDDDHTQYLTVARHDADDHSSLSASDIDSGTLDPLRLNSGQTRISQSFTLYRWRNIYISAGGTPPSTDRETGDVWIDYS